MTQLQYGPGDHVIDSPITWDDRVHVCKNARLHISAALTVAAWVHAEPCVQWIVLEPGGSVTWQFPQAVYANWWDGDGDFGLSLTRCRQSLNLAGAGPREVRIFGEQTLLTSVLWTGTIASPATRSVRLTPESCLLRNRVAGGIGIDLTGAQKITISPMLEMLCEDVGDGPPAAGIVASRNLQTDMGSGPAGAGEHRLDVRVTGSCSVACVALIGSESCRVDATVHNDVVGAAGFIAASGEHWGLASADPDCTLGNTSTAAQLDLEFLEAWAPSGTAVLLDGFSHVRAGRIVGVAGQNGTPVVIETSHRNVVGIDLPSVYCHPYGTIPAHSVVVQGTGTINDARIRLQGSGDLRKVRLAVTSDAVEIRGWRRIDCSATATSVDWIGSRTATTVDVTSTRLSGIVQCAALNTPVGANLDGLTFLG